jgi:hypothetical protein
MVAWSQNARHTTWNRTEAHRRPLPLPAPVHIARPEPCMAGLWEACAAVRAHPGELLFATHCREQLDGVTTSMKMTNDPRFLGAGQLAENVKALVMDWRTLKDAALERDGLKQRCDLLEEGNSMLRKVVYGELFMPKTGGGLIEDLRAWHAAQSKPAAAQAAQ